MNFWNKGAVVIIPAMVLVGCGTSGEVQEDTAAGQASTAPSTTSSTPAFTSGVTTGSAAAQDTQVSGDTGMQQGVMQGADQLDDPNSLLAKLIIYFDFDKSDVRSEFNDIIQAHANYLASHPTASITLEGHGDERGTREYNIALGERRAQSVQRLLTLQGASATQIRTISYGEERPVSAAQSEEAYALNRRVEIVYKR